MDTYSGYNQIKMHLEDENKTAFTIGCAIYCYRVMLFGLKNSEPLFNEWLTRSSKT